eukprot:7383042-Prymnesium_polylepis.1
MPSRSLHGWAARRSGAKATYERLALRTRNPGGARCNTREQPRNHHRAPPPRRRRWHRHAAQPAAAASTVSDDVRQLGDHVSRFRSFSSSSAQHLHLPRAARQKRLTKHKRGGHFSLFVHTSRGVLATPD